MKVLVTAFEPFGGESLNAAQESVKGFGLKKSAQFELIIEVLPTVFGKSTQEAIGFIDEYQPDIVIALGQAKGRGEVSVERVAINVNDADIPDNDGVQFNEEAIAPDGPAAYFSTLPIKEIVHSLRAAGIPASVSNTAGTFVCNELMFGLLHHVHNKKLNTKVGFIHVPCLPEQVVYSKGVPSMSKGEIAKALSIAIATSVELS